MTMQSQVKKFIPSKPIPFEKEWFKLTEELTQVGVHPKIAVDFQTIKKFFSSKSKLNSEEFKLFCDTCYFIQKEMFERADLEMIFNLTYIPPFSLEVDCSKYWLNEDIRDEIIDYVKNTSFISQVTRKKTKITAKNKSIQILTVVRAKKILMEYQKESRMEEMELLWNIASIPQLHYIKSGMRDKYETYLWTNIRYEKLLQEFYSGLEKSKLSPSQKVYSALKFSSSLGK